MKRLNPQTNAAFEKGWSDHNSGRVFFRYKGALSRDGYFLEEWVTRDAWERKYKPGVRKNGKERLNPETQEPFEAGFVDEKGRVFRQYDRNRLTDNGFFVESWFKDKNSWKRNQEHRRQAGKRKNQRLKSQGPLELTKRENPNTGKAFRKGDLYNGKYFVSYEFRTRKLGTDYFFENWATPESWAKYRQNERTPARIASVLCNHARQRAKKHGGKYGLDKSEIQKKIENGFCEVTGLKFILDIPKSKFAQPFSPSLDRIDNENRDYTHENVRVVITAFNLMRGELDEVTLKRVIEAYLKNN